MQKVWVIFFVGLPSLFKASYIIFIKDLRESLSTLKAAILRGIHVSF